MKRFILRTDRVRENAIAEVRRAPADAVVTLTERTRTVEQNAKLHAMISDIAASGIEWAGKRRTFDEWKVLIVSGHAVATGKPGDVIPGLEGEFVAIRESTALMGVSRCASLIEYLQAFGDQHGVVWSETERGGFMTREDAAA